MRLHERTPVVAQARNALHMAALRIADEYDLTALELSRCAIDVADRASMLALRAERHPDEPEKKADEA